MKTLVVYDSYFGNTEKIAQAVGAALGVAETDIRRVGSVTVEDLRGVELLMVGSPTRGFRPSEATTALLTSIPAGALQGLKIAAFDTRIDPRTIKNPIFRWIVTRGGYAAPKIAKELIQKGAQSFLEPDGFIVEASEGPLRDGELERAANWAQKK
jgi:flavodoxin